MARPKKIGLGYFPLDCQMDDKVEMLEAEHGLEGFAAYIKLLQAIYQTEAGELDMSVVFRWKTLAKSWGMSADHLRAIVATMLEVALFDKIAFEQRQVLTSDGIQKRISTVGGLRDKDRKRKGAENDSFPDGKPVENLRKSAQKEKEKESTSNDVPPPPELSDDLKARLASLTDTSGELLWRESILTKPAYFAKVACKLVDPETDVEYYRRAALIVAEADSTSRSISGWESWVVIYLTNQLKRGPLLKNALVDLTRPTPRELLPMEGSDCTGRHIVLPNTGDANLNRIAAQTYTKNFPNATIHHTRP